MALAPLAVFWPLGAPFFSVAAFFEEAFSGATCAPCAATAAVWVVLWSWFFMVLFLSVQWLALASRMTIDRSGSAGKQVKSAGETVGGCGA